MRVSIDGRPFQFQPPNNGKSARKLCEALTAAGFALRPNVARIQVGEKPPRAVESEISKLLQNRTVDGRLQLIRWLCTGRVELLPDAPEGAEGDSGASYRWSAPAEQGVFLQNEDTRFFLRLPPRDQTLGLKDLVGYLRSQRIHIRSDVFRLLQTNPRQNWIQALDARLRRCTRPEVMAAIVRQILPSEYKVLVPDMLELLQFLGRPGIKLVVDGQPVTIPDIRTMGQVRQLCGLLRRSGVRLRSSLGNPPFASGAAERRQVMIILTDTTVDTPGRVRRMVEWLADAGSVRMA